MLEHLDTPCIVIDLPTAQRNNQRMAAGLRAQGIAWRPHFKAHKSLFFARTQLDAGAAGMTCATLGEAEILVDGGIDDIFIAYPIIGTLKIGRMLALEGRASISSVVNSVEGARMLSEAYARAGQRARVLVELEGGMGRSGVTLENLAEFAGRIKDLPGLEILGAMNYCGGIYGLAKEDYEAHIRREAGDLVAARGILEGLGIAVSVLSSGSSFSSKMPEFLAGITEARPGNYLFNDVAQLSVGLVGEQDCALTVLAAVVTLPAPGKAVIDAGSKTLTMDTTAFGKGFGRVLGLPGATIDKLSEEHGYLTLPEGMRLEVGDRVRVIPNHACVVPNLADELYILDGEEGFFTPVDARGRNR